MTKIKAGIIGGAGYTGGELIRLLLQHTYVEIAFIHSRSNAGKPIYAVHADLLGDTELKFTDTIQPADTIFLCAGHGEARKFLEENVIDATTKIIDLSQDFRLQSKQPSNGDAFIYGLPELQRDKIKQAKRIANPGCFATAIQLGLLPLAKAGLLNEVYTTGITGSTGAGQSLQPTTHFTWRADNISAYKTLTHQHIAEIRQSLESLNTSPVPAINFIPWRGDFTRGIYVSSCLSFNGSLDEVKELYKTFYKGHPFTIVSDTMIDLKQVVNTNKCLIHLEKEGDKLVIHSAIDNLLKGASGQAIQNMNLLFGIDETSGLRLKPSAF